MPVKLKNYLLPILAVLAAIIIALCFLFKTPPAGVSDNGSFFPALKSLGLYNLENADISYVNYKFGINPGGSFINTFSSSYNLALSLSLKVSNVFYGKDLYDVRSLALIYLTLFVIAVYFTAASFKFSKPWLNYLSLFFLIFILLDLSWLLYFNSFYIEALQFVSLFLCVSGFLYSLSREKKILGTVVFYFGALLFATCSPKCLFPAVLLTLAYAITLWKQSIAVRALTIALSLVITASGIFSSFNLDKDIYSKNIYNSVFTSIAAEEATANGSLAKLGLDYEQLKDFVNKPYYEIAGNESAKETLNIHFYNKISYAKITGYYFLNIGAFFKELGKTYNNALIVPTYLSNITAGSGENKNIIGLWSMLKLNLLIKMAVYGVWYLVIYLLAFIYGFIKGNKTIKKGSFLYLSLLLSATYLFKINPIAYGSVETAKNLFLFNFVFDIMFCITVIWGIYALINRRDELKSKFGVKQ